MKQHFQAWLRRPGWERFVHLIAAVSFAVATAVFCWLAYRAGDPQFTEMDEQVIRSLRREGAAVGGAGWVNVMRDVTAMGSAAVLGTVTLLILGYLCWFVADWLGRQGALRSDTGESASV